MLPGIILGLGMLVFPESPRWLYDHGREEEALQVLADLHGGGDRTHELVALEYAEIKQQVILSLWSTFVPVIDGFPGLVRAHRRRQILP